MALRTLSFMILCVACTGPQASVQRAQPLQSGTRNHLYVAVSDFSSGGVKRADLTKGEWDSEVFPAHADALPRWDAFADQLLILNRLAGSHLTIATPALSLVKQIGLPEASNPQDVLALGAGTAYLSSYHDTHLRRWDLTTGKQVGNGIDLAEWKDGDSFAEASYLFDAGSRVLLALQRLDMSTYLPSGDAVLVVVDPLTDTVDKGATRSLALRNPFTEFKTWDGDIFIGEAGAMDRKKAVLDGGIERIDGREFHSKGIVITEGELGGDILDFEILTVDRAVAVIGTPQTDVVLFNPAKGKRERSLLQGGGYRYSQVLVDRTREVFYLADRLSESPSVRVFGFDGVERTESRLALELPPFKMVLAP